MKRDTESATNYLAGLFDSKGAIKIETPAKGKSPSLFAWITAKDFKVIEFCNQKFGAKVGQRSDGQFRAKWKDRFAHNILSQIYNSLLTKKDQAQVGIEFFKAKEKNELPDNEYIVYLLRLKLLKKEDVEAGG